MGSSNKKKDKKKKKRRHSDEEGSPKRDDEYYYDKKKHSKKSKYDNDEGIPETEEYVYDYSGQEIVQSSSSRRSPDNHRSKSRKDKKREKSPSLMPPGTEWSAYDDKEDGEVDWKEADDVRRDREYQDEVDRKYKEKQRAEKRRNSMFKKIIFENYIGYEYSSNLN